MIGKEEIEKRFGTHEVTTHGDDPTFPKHEQIRMAFTNFLEFLDELTPDGRAKSIMATHLEDAAMWANKAVSYEAPLVRD